MAASSNAASPLSRSARSLSWSFTRSRAVRLSLLRRLTSAPCYRGREARRGERGGEGEGERGKEERERGEGREGGREGGRGKEERERGEGREGGREGGGGRG